MAPRDEQEPDDSFENVKTVFLDAGGPPDAAGVANPMRTPPFAERYELERLLGEGGMGTVLLYRDRQIGRRVAAKSMRPEAAAQAHLRERFVHEAQVQGQLEHPSIVPV